MTKNPRLGSYVTSSIAGESYKAFVPSNLPPSPAIDLSSIQKLLDKAYFELGKLDAITSQIPDIKLLLYYYVRKEALLSSQIEGTQSSFDDLIMFESKEVPNVPIDDVEEVTNYVAALNHALKRIESGFPLSLRLIKETHAILLKGGRGSTKQPGEFRKSQNWIGGTRPGNAQFVPPPPEQVIKLMSNLELYLHDKYGQTPTLLKAAIAHVQFETIHPFLDGNGRLGRLLITLMLCVEGVMKLPVLYLSLYIKRHRKVYYDLLDRVRIHGDWETWIEFFLEAVIRTAEEASSSTKKILQLFEKDKNKIAGLKRAAPSALRVFEYMQKKPICKIPALAKALKMSQPTATASLMHLVDLKIVKESSGKQRDKTFVYEPYLDILREGT